MPIAGTVQRTDTEVDTDTDAGPDITRCLHLFASTWRSYCRMLKRRPTALLQSTKPGTTIRIGDYGSAFDACAGADALLGELFDQHTIKGE